MKERLLEFLRSENKSSAQLAEEIGVQASGISHILSGRNNPSLDFVLKMLEKYQFLSSDWLLFGKGTMYKEPKMQSLFAEENFATANTSPGEVKADPGTSLNATPSDKAPVNLKSTSEKTGNKYAISRIVMFYDDNTFNEYTPRE